MRELSDRVRQAAQAAGFELAGIAAARPAPQAERLHDWLAAGMHGGMRWMDDPDGRRADPTRWVEWARSLVLVGLAYDTGHAHDAAPDRGVVSRYAWGRDYHREVRARLERLRAGIERLAPGCRTQPFVDTSPVLEKNLAEAAGLGWQGKHTNLIAERGGSWFFLGGLATDLELEPDAPAVDRCGTCVRCIDVCPTRAIVAPYVLDARLCIAYLTIENRGPIEPALRPAIGNRIFGCDDCQDVCPWNRHAVRARGDAFEPRDGNLNPSLLEWIGMSRTEWNRRFKHTPVRRATYPGFIRNVAVALGNWGAAEAAAPLAARLDDEYALVRGHVAWALGRVCGETARAALAARRAVEPDEWVCEEIEAALAASVSA